MKKRIASRIATLVISAAMICGSILPVSAAGAGAAKVNDDLIGIEDSVYAAPAKLPGTIKVTKTDWNYTGNKITPSLTVKDGTKTVAKKYYTVALAKGDNGKNVGEHKITVKFKAPYSGSKTLSYNIVPKGTSVSSVLADDKSITVKYKKQATQTTGYQIQYSTSSKFSSVSTVKVSKNSTVSKKITGLKAGTKYYVRVGTYSVVNGKTYVSDWSASKSVKTKEDTDPDSDKFDNLTLNSILDTMTIDGKSIRKWTPSSLQAYLKSQSTSTIDGKIDGKKPGTAYMKGDYALGYYFEKMGYSSAEIAHSSAGSMWVEPYDDGRLIYGADYCPNEDDYGFQIDDTELAYVKSNPACKHPLKDTLKETVETICPGLYEKLSVGETFNAKNFKATMNSKNKITIQFGKNTTVEIGGGDGETWIDITTTK